MIISGNEVKLGDVLNLWIGKVRVAKLSDYSNDFARTVWPEGARIAKFDNGREMTLGNKDLFELSGF